MSSHHISTDKTLLTVGGALFVLTLLTAGIHFLYLPQPWSIIAAMVVAISKGLLVLLVFMNLYWDKKFNGLVFAFSFLFLALLVGYSLLDILFRPEVISNF